MKRLILIFLVVALVVSCSKPSEIAFDDPSILRGTWLLEEGENYTGELSLPATLELEATYLSKEHYSVIGTWVSADGSLTLDGVVIGIQTEFLAPQYEPLPISQSFVADIKRAGETIAQLCASTNGETNYTSRLDAPGTHPSEPDAFLDCDDLTPPQLILSRAD